MKKTILNQLVLLPLAMCFINSFAQQSMAGSGGDGTGTGGTFSFSFGQFAYHTYFEAKSSVAEGIQHPFDINIVPTLLSVVDTIIKNGEAGCFNALQTITIAGECNNVVVSNGASADFIAGESIRFLPGFHAKSGSNVHATITTSGDYCDGWITPSIVQVPPETKSSEIETIVSTDNNLLSEMQVKVYPNPNNGRFTINLINFESRALVSIYNLTGTVFYQSGIEELNQTEINLPYLRNGIYFIRVTSDNKQFVKKIIKKK
jgi:hypothetical protein